MKHCLFLFVGFCFFAITSVQAGITDLINPNKIYVFTQTTCPHCAQAESNLKQQYPDLDIQWKDISKQENWQLMLACAAKFKLEKSKLGTPLFCMGDNYIIGWSKREKDLFQEYVKPFLPEE